MQQTDLFLFIIRIDVYNVLLAAKLFQSSPFSIDYLANVFIYLKSTVLFITPNNLQSDVRLHVLPIY